MEDLENVKQSFTLPTSNIYHHISCRKQEKNKTRRKFFFIKIKLNMNLKETLIIGLIVALQEQIQLLTQCIEVMVSILDEEDEEDFLEEISRPFPQRIWKFNRYGTFWEKDVPNNGDEFFKESFRVEREYFSLLIQKLEVLRKKDTNFRNAIPLQKRIAIALYALGSSAEYRTVGRLFGVSTSIVCKILHEFCRAVIENLSEEYLPPNFLTESKVEECVQGFNAIGFPQCLGAIDGCHIEVKPSATEAVDHYNYKGWYSVVLFALVDFRYRFLYVNVGCPGRCNDSLIYRKSKLSQMLDSCNILKEKKKDICSTQVSVFIIGDSAFKFSPTLMKPYPFSTSASLEQQTFNYNLSKARRVVENAFGHLKARFRRIGKGLDNHQKFNSRIIMCCCILHNFLNEHNSAINENWKLSQQTSLPQPEYSNTSADQSVQAENIRSAISRYLCERNSSI